MNLVIEERYGGVSMWFVLFFVVSPLTQKLVKKRKKTHHNKQTKARQDDELAAVHIY
jgi:hypothetical protein